MVGRTFSLFMNWWRRKKTEEKTKKKRRKKEKEKTKTKKKEKKRKKKKNKERKKERKKKNHTRRPRCYNTTRRKEALCSSSIKHCYPQMHQILTMRWARR